MESEPASLRARMKRRLPDFDHLRDRIRVRARALRHRFRGGSQESLAERLTEIDEEFVKRGAEDVTEVDLDTVVERADDIEERFRTNGPLQRLIDDGRLLLGLVQDARRGHYRRVPVWTLCAAGFTLLYVLNPFDLVPDALPVLGLLDDAAVVSACFSLLEQDLHNYRAWKRNRLADESEEDAPEDLISS